MTGLFTNLHLNDPTVNNEVFISDGENDQNISLDDIIIALKKAKNIRAAYFLVNVPLCRTFLEILTALPNFKSLTANTRVILSDARTFQRFTRTVNLRSLIFHDEEDFRPSLAEICTFLQECPTLKNVQVTVAPLTSPDIDSLSAYIARNLAMETFTLLLQPKPLHIDYSTEQMDALINAFYNNTHIQHLPEYLPPDAIADVLLNVTRRNRQAMTIRRLENEKDVVITPEDIFNPTLPSAVANAPNLRILRVPRMPLQVELRDAICMNTTIGRIQVGPAHVSYQDPRIHAHVLENQSRFMQQQNQYWKHTTHASFPSITGICLLTAMLSGNRAPYNRLPGEMWRMIFNHLQRRDFNGDPDYFVEDRRRERVRLTTIQREEEAAAQYAAQQAAIEARQLTHSHWRDTVFTTEDGIITFYAIQCIHSSIHQATSYMAEHTNIRPVYVSVTYNPVTFCIVRGPQLNIDVFSTTKSRQAMCELISHDYLHGDVRAKKELEIVRCTSNTPLPCAIERYIRDIVSVWYQLYVFPIGFVIQ